jgi:PhzF family phenazine biosynthesis protein
MQDDRLAFAAPKPLRRGPLEPDLLERVCRALQIWPAEVVAHQWVDNGPGWVAVLLESAERVLAIEPDPALVGSLKIGVVGPEKPGAVTDFQLRALSGTAGQVIEDPVTGSLNASVAQWLIESGRAPAAYTAGQGARLGRDGRIYIDRIDDQVWVAGDVVTCVAGTALL